MDERQMPRKLTVYLAAPPADGLVPARDHFNEYVKPILVAAALDWDAIEGRREGDVRAGLAERIRRLRKKRGETTSEPVEEDLQEILEVTRERAGIRDWDGPGGDIVIGRHTWKEYVRGLHEGWLGPLDAPAFVAEELAVPKTSASESAPPASPPPSPPTTEPAPSTPSTADDTSPVAAFDAPKPEETEKPKEEEEKKPQKKKQPPPFISTPEYQDATLSLSCPRALGPSTVIPFPHLLGFFNFPIRMYRFLNRRKVADDIGRQTAAAVFGAYAPYHAPSEIASVSDDGASENSRWEQQGLLTYEEPEWHKSVRERKDDDTRERVWLDGMVLDPRIGERMRKFELDAETEDRAAHIPSEKSGSWFQSLWPKKEEKKLWEGLDNDTD